MKYLNVLFIVFFSCSLFLCLWFAFSRVSELQQIALTFITAFNLFILIVLYYFNFKIKK